MKFLCGLFLSVGLAIFLVSAAYADPLTEFRAESLISNAEKVAFLKAVSFSKVVSVKIAKIDSDYQSNPRIRDDTNSPKFHNFILVSEWLEYDDTSDAGLTECLKTTIKFWLESYGRARDGDVVTINPFYADKADYAVRLETDKGRRDFVTSLACPNLIAFDDKGRSMQFRGVPYPGLPLRRFYENKFPSDEPRPRA